MHGCASGSLLLVNAEVDSMGGVIDGGVEISSTPSLQQTSDLEKTQAELRQTFTAAEKFRRELEFLQKGGDPLDLKTGTAASVSVQSTSLTDQHPEQFVTSEVKGSFAITASPHGDSVESSGRLGAPSVGEPNSADNLMLFDGDNKFRQVERRSLHPRTNNNAPSERYSQLDVGHNAKIAGESVALELPKKSYKRRIRSRPNRDGARSSSTDVGPPRSGQSFFPSRNSSKDTKGLVQDAGNQEQKYLSNSNSKPKSPNASVALRHLASNSHLDLNLNRTQTLKDTQENLVDHPSTSDIRETSSVGCVKQEAFSGLERPSSADTHMAGSMALRGQTSVTGTIGERNIISNDCNGRAALPTKGLDSKSSCSQTGQSLEGNNKNEFPTSTIKVRSNGALELNLASKKAQSTEGNDLNTVKDGSALRAEEGLRKSELQNELKKPAFVAGDDIDGCTDRCLDTNSTTFQESTLPHQHSIDGAEQNARSQNNLKLATKEQEDLILEEARIIEEKRRRIGGLSVRNFPLEIRHKSHWDFVLEEMSWLANDFAQERLWKVTAAAQISRRVAFTSQVRFQQQSSLRKQKEVAHTLAEAVMEFWLTTQVKCQELELEGPKKDSTFGLQGYAMRFLEYNSTHAQYSSAQAPVTPDRISDLGIIDISWEENLTEENLFYTVPPGAIEAYRKSIESHLLQCERTGSSMQEEVDTSGYDVVADNTLEEEEGETSTYYLPGAFEGSKSSKSAQKKNKHFKMGTGLSFMQSLERNIRAQPSVISGKRPATSINVSIPTKRVRTASRSRFTGTSGGIQAPNRADASSGDTNSFQDEQSSLHGGYQIQNNMEAESVGDYEKQVQFDSTEVSNRPKKKKKAKHPGSAFVHRWQLDSNFQSDQKDHSKRRLDARQFDSNGNSVASQMSNMSNPNKFMKLLVRDRGRKAKSLKTPPGQPGSGSPWSLFEDQALVVLVHDLGPNWELISDAINSTLQFKCISRKSKECKERHKTLMDRNTGDGADSAEDSGSSQPYPSTLPGIPEGSARQLFQRLQGPTEENTLKSHFEKIIMIGQKQHYRKQKNENQDPKQLQQPHGSHALALSQVCPNNLNGGPVLTPLDLCDAISTSPDFLPIGYQGPNQGNIASIVPGSSSTSSQPGSSNGVLASHLSSASAPLNTSVREGRYGIPRTGSLSIEDQQRMQHYNQMLSNRNMQQSNLSRGSHSGTDQSVRMLAGGTGLGVMSGMNRSMAMARPGFQGVTSSSMLNSSSMHPGAGPAQGNSVRPREALHMMRPNQNTDHQSQMMAPDHQMPLVTQGGSTPGVPPFASGTTSFSNQTTQPHVQSYPLHHQPPAHPPHLHGPPNQHPAYQVRFIKDRQLQQQRLLQHQLPVTSPQKSTQSSVLAVVSPSGTTSVNPMPKHPVPPPHGLVRNPQTGGNPLAKQRQRQPQQFQQSSRQHPQQRQPPQSPPAKILKGGRGKVHATDPSLPNGLTGSQSAAENHLLQSGPGNSYSGPSSLNRFSVQLQQHKPSHSSDNSNNQNHTPSVAPPSSAPPVVTTNHRQPHPPQKPVNQTQATSAQRMVHNRKANSSEPHNDSSSAVSDNPAWVSKVSVGMSPPQSSSPGTESEHSGPVVNHSVVNRQSSSDRTDSLPNSVGRDAGVQWQQQPSS